MSILRRSHDTVSRSVIIYYTFTDFTEYSKLAVHLWTNNLANGLPQRTPGDVSSTPGAILVYVCLLYSLLILQHYSLQMAHPNLKTLTFPAFLVWLLGTMSITITGSIHPVFRVYTGDNLISPWCIHMPAYVQQHRLRPLNEESNSVILYHGNIIEVLCLAFCMFPWDLSTFLDSTHIANVLARCISWAPSF